MRRKSGLIAKDIMFLKLFIKRQKSATQIYFYIRTIFFSYALDSEFTEYILYASMCLVFGPHDSEKAGISSYRKWA